MLVADVYTLKKIHFAFSADKFSWNSQKLQRALLVHTEAILKIRPGSINSLTERGQLKN